MTYTRNILLIFIFGFFTIIGASYAADTIIQNISGGQTSDIPGSYQNNTMTISNGDLKFINAWGNNEVVGDYFLGYYYDPAFGVFEILRNPGERLRIISESSSQCPSSHDDYKLDGYSYNVNFWFIDFNYDSSIYSYICIPKDPNNPNLNTYFGWYAYSPYIGFQSLSGIDLDASVDLSGDHDSDGRNIKVDGIAASTNSQETLLWQFDDEVRIIGELTKSSFRKDVHQKVFQVIKNISIENGSTPFVVNRLWNSDWSVNADGAKFLQDSVLYFSMTGQDVRIDSEDNIEWEKTLIVEGWNIYINGDIKNSDGDGILGLIALEKDGIGGNIYINPSVTDIHAIIYADRSLISYDEGNELDGSTLASELANQLYIRWSVFSENTIWASQKNPAECPFYVDDSNCNTESKAMKYDLNFLRKYILVQPIDADWNPAWPRVPQFGAAQSYGNTGSRGGRSEYERFPVIIEYDSRIQQNPPPLF